MQYVTWSEFPGNMNRVVLGEYDIYKTKPQIVDLDLNVDYVLDGIDLGMLLGRWGDPYDGADLALLLANWGNVWHRQDGSGGSVPGRYYVIPPSLGPVIASDPQRPDLSFLGWGPGGASFVTRNEVISGETEFPGWAEHARARVEYVDRISSYIVHQKSLDQQEGIEPWQQQSSGTAANTTSQRESPPLLQPASLTMSSLSLAAFLFFLLLTLRGSLR